MPLPETTVRDSPIRESPLAAANEAAGATFTEFSGWRMPVRYSGDLAEHAAVRRAAGVFDVSHMGEITVSGLGAGAFLDAALAGRVSRIALLQAKYSMILGAEGGVLDDLIVYKTAEHQGEPADAADEYLVVANAGNREAVAAALIERARAFPGVVVEDRTDDYALLALQGPAAERILAAVEGLGVLGGAPLGETLAAVRNYRAVGLTWRDTTILAARTGYTGEDGFELMVDVEGALAFWDALLEAGAPLGLVPAGLAARDTLRLEAGMPLYGHELGLDVHPAQAGLGRVVVDTGDGMVARDWALAGPIADAPVLVGLSGTGRRAARAGYPVLDAAGETVGAVTSGVLSPTLGHPIALASVHPSVAAVGTALEVDVRGTRLPFTVVETPFYRRAKTLS